MAIKIATKHGQYRRDGQPRFVYTMTGTKEELADYKAVKGAFYKESENKEPLWFSKKPLVLGVNLIKTTNNLFIIEEDLEVVANKQTATEDTVIGKFNALIKLGVERTEALKLCVA
jgi:hypothetical protein